MYNIKLHKFQPDLISYGGGRLFYDTVVSIQQKQHADKLEKDLEGSGHYLIETLC